MQITGLQQRNDVTEREEKEEWVVKITELNKERKLKNRQGVFGKREKLEKANIGKRTDR